MRRTLLHEFHHRDNSVAVFSRGLKSLMEQFTEFPQRLAIRSAQHLDVLQRQLERRGLEPDIPRRVRQHEPKVNMDQVTVAVQQDVAVMAVLDLEEVGDYGVPGQRFRKVSLGTGKFCGGWISIGLKRYKQKPRHRSETHILKMIHKSDVSQSFTCRPSCVLGLFD